MIGSGPVNVFMDIIKPLLLILKSDFHSKVKAPEGSELSIKGGKVVPQYLPIKLSNVSP